MKHRKRMIGAGAVMLLAALMLSACGGDMGISDTKVVFTSGLGKTDVFRIEDEICTQSEMMVYLMTARNQYEAVYGEEIWQVDLQGEKLEDGVKETVLAQAAQIKSMYLLAKEREIPVTQQEEQLINSAAAEYYSTLTEADKEVLGADLKMFRQLYREYVMADKVYESIIAGVNPEISDDEARRVTVQHIWLKNYMEDGNGGTILLSDTKQHELYEQAEVIRQQIVEGSQDFAQAASKYGAGEKVTYALGKGESDRAIEKAVFELETGEVSRVIETDTGYHIFKCLNTLDREETDLNKIKIMEQRKNQAFSAVYDDFIKHLDRKLNMKLWESISLTGYEQSETVAFFDIYNKYFKDNQ